MNDYILFDLDGTLTDPKVGITTCVQYALASFGIDEPDLDKLTPFIGPPLKESFMEFYDFDETKAEAAIEKYRERFKDTGIFENDIYPGIADMIRKLKGNSKKIAVASSKPTVYVERILEHFEIKRYFDVIVGSELDGTRTDKAEVVREALSQLYKDDENIEEKKKNTVMVGDRKFDVAGAKAEGIGSIAVTYGYGPMDELKISKPDYIVRSVAELEKVLLRGNEKQQAGPKKVPMIPMNKLWILVFPALLFYFIRELGSYVGVMVVSFLGNELPKNISQNLVTWDETGKQLNGVTALGSAIILFIAFVLTGIVIWRFFCKADIKKAEEAAKLKHSNLKSPVAYLCMITASIGAALGLNYLFELLGITNSSQAYQDVASIQYGVPIYVGLFLYGLIIPFIEELMFRGVVFNRARRYYNFIISTLVSSIFFGIYHQNLVQGTYAFLMGCLICFCYERFGHFYVPVIVHIISNVVAYMMTFIAGALSMSVNWPVCIILLLIAAASIFYLSRPVAKMPEDVEA